MLHTPFYDPLKSYDENYDKGPFGAFSDGKIYAQTGEPTYEFLGQKVFLPFGIPAGPVLNSAFVKASFEKGFDLVIYKTVRSNSYPCHPFPNVLSVEIQGDLTLAKAKNPLVANDKYHEPLSITNSFGVPSKVPEYWQNDAKKAISYAGPGQVLIMSFMGTVKEGQTQGEFVADFAQAGRLAAETGAKILEANLSCPNIGDEGLVCYNLTATEEVCRAIRKSIGNVPLILKIGYFADNKQLEQFTDIANKYAQGISAINTIAAPIIDTQGKQALPGKMRMKSGVCGAGIKWAALDMVKKLVQIKKDKNHQYNIIGVGGVTKPEDYFEMRKAGADAVMSATGAMWDPYLAQEIKKQL